MIIAATIRVEEGKVVHSEVVDTNGSGHGALAGVLNALNADVFLQRRLRAYRTAAQPGL